MKISKRHLSLRGMRTFCAAARHQNFRVAAQSLFVTPSAVSHQIRKFEAELGIELFERGPRSLALTAAGSALYAEAQPLIDELDRVAQRYRAGARRETLRISVQPFFASEMFMPRLRDFTQAHPDIDLHLDTSDEDPGRHPASADVSIRTFRRAPPGHVAEAFFPLRVLPACSAALRETIRTAPDVPFPIVVHSGRADDWERWHAATGIALPKPRHVVQVNSMIAVIRAAEQGLGVALAPMPVCRARFEAGDLVALHAQEADTPERYYFVSTKAAGRTRSVRALRQWVLSTFVPLA